MARAKTALFLCALAIATSVGGTAPHAAAEDDCSNAPLDAVITLPSPIRKWGEISCTSSGHVLSSRDGWIWALLESATTVGIPSQTVRKNEASVDDVSYFTSIETSELGEEEFTVALSIFHDGLNFEETEAHGYRAELTSVSGRSTTIIFFDFGSFAGGMWCPGGGCIPDSRFLIMESEHKAKRRPPSI